MHKVAKREKRNISPEGAFHCWYEERKPFLVYAGKFVCLLFLVCLLSLTPAYRAFLEQEAAENAALARGMLSLFESGESAISGATLFRGQEAILEVKTKCSGLYFCWLLCAAILPFPAPWGLRILGAVLGSLILLALNILRIITLFLVGCHYPGWFSAAHEQVWPLVSLLVTMVLMGAWLVFVRRSEGAA